MRPPQHLIESLWFLFTTEAEFLQAMSGQVDGDEIEEISRLSKKGLPPVTSIDALSTIIGINSGIVWSFVLRPHRYYRIFILEKGRKRRTIQAPRVGLKLIQKWMSFHLSRSLPTMPHVYGFVPSRSHIDAAFLHRGAQWAYSIDIIDFFQTTPEGLVAHGLVAAGYNPRSAALIATLSCLNGNLAQGAPTSPTLSNLAFVSTDQRLAAAAARYGARLTRFADDIVFSGHGAFPEQLRQEVHALFDDSPWSLSPTKERLEPLDGRIKVHGLIVNGSGVRLTKGYRNKLRAYRHVLSTRRAPENEVSLRGHVEYAQHVDRRLSELYEGRRLLPADMGEDLRATLDRWEQGSPNDRHKPQRYESFEERSHGIASYLRRMLSRLSRS